jgi:hypothetical protein
MALRLCSAMRRQPARTPIRPAITLSPGPPLRSGTRYIRATYGRQALSDVGSCGTSASEAQSEHRGRSFSRSQSFTLAGRLILVEVSRFDAGSKQRIALQVERLAAVGLTCM